MSQEWFTAKELAGLPGVPATHSAVVRRAKRDGWDFRQRQGRGGGREYAFASLPIETQAALLKQQAPKKQARKPAPVATSTTGREELWEVYDAAPNSMKEQAERRLAILEAIQKLKDNGATKTEAIKQAMETYQESRATLYRWEKLANSVAKEDRLAALMPAYVGGRPEAECDEAAWDRFKAFYLTPERRTVAQCYDLVAQMAKENGWNWPALRTINRKVKQIPRHIRVLEREGENAMLRLYPSMQRTVRDLHALYWLNGDGYQHNVFVRLPNGEIGRPKTWFWQDIYSRQIVGFRTDQSENTDMIRLALGDVIEHYGIPEHITIDNTRAAANKWLTGGVSNRYRFKVKETDPLGLLPQLGIEVHWTSVVAGKGWGQAKPVERAFGVGGIGEYVDKHPKFSGAYTGPNPMAKPDNYGETAVEWDVFMKTLRQAIDHWNAKENRRTEVCAGVRSFHQAFQESYQRNADKVRRATAAQRRLWLMQAESVLVQRDATVALTVGNGPNGKNRYGSDFLVDYAGQRVVVRFDPDQLHEQVHIYRNDGRYLGAADCLLAAGFGDTNAGREWNRENKRRSKAAKLASQAEKRMTALEAAKYLPEPEEQELPEVETNVRRGDFGRVQKAVAGSDITEQPYQSPADKYGFNDAMERHLAKFKGEA